MKLLALAFALTLMPNAYSLAEERIRALATFAPLHSLTAQVAGHSADVEMLLPESAEPHGFAFSPADLRRLSEAEVIVKNGLGLESWLERAIEASARPGRTVVDSSAGVETLPLRDGDARHGHDHDASANPHIWLDPLRAIRQVENIRDGLAKADPANASAYHANTAAFIERLRDLDRELREKLEPLAGAAVISSHEALDYFAARYGLRIVGVLELRPGSRPTPKYLMALHALAKREGVRAFLVEPGGSSRIMKSLADDLGTPVVDFDPMETGKASADFYEQTMRRNAEALAAALAR